ncbi:VOC family protein [Planctomycetaceae bacterium SH139]
MRCNSVGWFELYVEDMDRATRFYETVLGTKLEKPGPPMDNLQMMAFPMSMESTGDADALSKMDRVKPGGVGTLFFFSLEDCAIEASRIEDAGGRIQMPKSSIAQCGFIALGIANSSIRILIERATPGSCRISL